MFIELDNDILLLIYLNDLLLKYMISKAQNLLSNK
jgi:hypothetical protein